MVSPYLSRLSKETGKSVEFLTEKWNKAKILAEKKFGALEESFTSKEYCFMEEIVKLELENTFDSTDIKPTDFLNTEKNAEEFIEDVVSGNFNIPNVTLSPSLQKDRDAYMKKQKEMIEPENDNATKPLIDPSIPLVSNDGISTGNSMQTQLESCPIPDDYLDKILNK